MEKIIIILGILLFAFIGTFITPIFERMHRRNKIRHRPIIPDDDIYSHFYSSSEFSKDVIIKLWSQISKILHVDAGKLRPDDKIIDLRGLRLSLNTDLDELEAFIASQVKSDASEPKSLERLDDIVRYIASERK